MISYLTSNSKNGKNAYHLESLDKGLRKRLDEAKRREIKRLNELTEQKIKDEFCEYSFY